MHVECAPSQPWSVKPLQRNEFSYTLPQHLIAQHPAVRREDSRLLRLAGSELEHLVFAGFPALIAPGDLLVLNDTQVIKARLHGEKDSGGRAEILVERAFGDLSVENAEAGAVAQEALCQVRVSKPLQPGRTLRVAGADIEVLERSGEFYRLRFPVPVQQFLERWGEVPLPPYIERPAGAEDLERYQTVFGCKPGAVAAPTAGLHFSSDMLTRLGESGVELARVTLHVGAGTFQPVRADDLGRHRMHSERYQISAATAAAVRRCRDRGGRVVAVGTTVVRALETVASAHGEVRAASGETDLFITPGYPFRVVDALLTNFHLPESTLLMLVCAFGGRDRVMAAYAAAVACGYRFFSYGDAMFLERS